MSANGPIYGDASEALWHLAGFAIVAAYFQDLTPLMAGMASEALYLAVVPATPFYRRLVERRQKERARWHSPCGAAGPMRHRHGRTARGP